MRILVLLLSMASSASAQPTIEEMMRDMIFPNLSLDCWGPAHVDGADRGQCGNDFFYIEWKERHIVGLAGTLPAVFQLLSKEDVELVPDFSVLQQAFPDLELLDRAETWEPTVFKPSTFRDVFCQQGNALPLSAEKGWDYFVTVDERARREETGTIPLDRVTINLRFFADVREPQKVYRCWQASSVGYLRTIDFFPTGHMFDPTLERGLVAQLASGML